MIEGRGTGPQSFSPVKALVPGLVKDVNKLVDITEFSTLFTLPCKLRGGAMSLSGGKALVESILAG